MGASALVVGIDIYDHPSIKHLSGAVADATDAVAWLLRIGLNAANIRLHLSPPIAAAIPAGVSVQAAGRDDIWASVHNLSQAKGEQLFVFLAGHGLFVPGAGEVFLTQDYGKNGDTTKNIYLTKFVEYFRSWAFRDQFVFFDACLTLSSTIGQISNVTPNGPAPAPGSYFPVAGNAMTVCYSASAGQKAIEVGGRGLLIRNTLPELDPAALPHLSLYAPQQNAIHYDWQTGNRWLDLKSLFDGFIGPKILDAAAKQRHVQTPWCEPHGRALTSGYSLILGLPKEPTAQVLLDVEPPEAIGDVQQIRVLTDPPPRPRYLPGAVGLLKLPDSFVMPQIAALNARVEIKPASGWISKNSPMDVPPGQNSVHVVLELAKAPPGPPQGPLSQFNVKVLDPNGVLAPVLAGYDEIASVAGIELPEDDEGPVRLSRHEDGPDISFGEGSEEAANQLAFAWQRAIGAHLRNRDVTYSVVISPPGATVEEVSNNLPFDIPDGGAQALAGFLADSPTVTVTPVGLSQASRRFSLRQLEERTGIRTEQGPNLVQIDLPWGSWSTFAQARDIYPLRCELPKNIGLQPLRNRVGRYVGGKREVDEVYLSAEPVGSPHLWPIELDAGGGRLMLASFPGLTLLMQQVEGTWRFEPMSRTRLAEWDLLLSAGRIADLSPDRLAELTATRPEDRMSQPEAALFRLALAYSALATRHSRLTLELVETLPEPARSSLDAKLLRLNAEILEGHDPGDAAISEAIGPIERNLLAPVLRWGVPLAQRLAGNDNLQRIAWLQGLGASGAWSVQIISSTSPDQSPTTPVSPVSRAAPSRMGLA